MALLASLGTGVVLAYGAHQKQLRQAERRLHAVQVADRLLARWYAGREIVPRNTGGRVVHRQQPWIWRTLVLNQAVLGRIPVETIRVEVYRDRTPGSRGPPVSAERPLAAVELIAPIEPVPSQLNIPRL